VFLSFILIHWEQFFHIISRLFGRKRGVNIPQAGVFHLIFRFRYCTKTGAVRAGIFPGETLLLWIVRENRVFAFFTGKDGAVWETIQYGIHNTEYGPKASVYGPKAGMYGMEAGMYGPEVSMYGPEVSMYGPKAGMYGTEAGMYGMEASVYGSGTDISPSGLKGWRQ
jgi:hypothetical protein